MGQMTHGVMLGVDASEHAEGLTDSGWYGLLRKYNAGDGPLPDYPHGSTRNPDVIGFWVAVGGSGADGCPDLDEGFALDGFLDVPEYCEALSRARKAWEKFAPWAAAQGLTLGEPRLWLVITEVA